MTKPRIDFLYKHDHCIGCGMSAACPIPLYPPNYIKMVGGIIHHNYKFPGCIACTTVAWRKIPTLSHPNNFWEKVTWLTEQAIDSNRPRNRHMMDVIAPIAEAALLRLGPASMRGSAPNDAMTSIGITDFLDSLKPNE